MTPQAAGGVGALEHSPGRVEAVVLIGGAFLPAGAIKLPGFLSTFTHSLLPVGSVCRG